MSIEVQGVARVERKARQAGKATRARVRSGESAVIAVTPTVINKAETCNYEKTGSGKGRKTFLLTVVGSL